MKKIGTTLIVMFLFASCRSQDAQVSVLPGPVPAVNDDLQFLKDLHKRTLPYSDEQMARWKMTEGSYAIPEPANFDNLEHVRLFVSANPDRYEGYVMYGLYFLKQKRYDVAVAAYDEAVVIIRKNKLKDTVEYRKYYSLSLVMLYCQQREHDRTLALGTFDKLVSFDFGFFDEVPRLANVITLAALDYRDADRKDDARRLIDRARSLKHLPSDVREKLEWLYKKKDVEQ